MPPRVVYPLRVLRAFPEELEADGIERGQASKSPPETMHLQ